MASEPVSIPYCTLLNSPETLLEPIERAFGPDGLGVVLITDLPAEFPRLRERLLRLARAFAALPQESREKYARAEVNYLYGWSHGKEIMNGRPDVNKGSYYANPVVDNPTVSQVLKDDFPAYYGQNVWPDADESGVEGFEEAFKALGSFIFQVGLLLAKAIEPFVAARVHDSAKVQGVEQMLRSSQAHKGRLLHYFPSESQPADAADTASTASTRRFDRKFADGEDDVQDDACGIHLDHSLLTGLVSALYLAGPENEAVKPPDPAAGLYICPRASNSQAVKVSIPADCLAFQTGEALELLTNRRLAATPHYVRGSTGQAVLRDGSTGSVSRETFAMFMQPDVDTIIGQQGETFGNFSSRVLSEHH